MNLSKSIFNILLFSLFFYSCSAKIISDKYNNENIYNIEKITGKISIKKSNLIISGYFKLIQTNKSYQISLSKNFLTPEKYFYISKNNPLKISKLIKQLNEKFLIQNEIIIKPIELLNILLGRYSESSYIDDQLKIEYLYKSFSSQLYPNLILLSFEDYEIKLSINSIL
jgi:hypothetical protein